MLPSAAVGLVRVKHGADQRQRAVGDHLFLEIAPEHEQRAAREIVKLEAAGLGQLVCQLVVPGNRALNELGEEGDKQRKLCGILFRGIFAVGYVDQVAHRLEGVKRDAQRQKQPQRRTAQHFQHGRGVLDQGQHAEVEQQHRPEDDALTLLGLGLERLFAGGVKLGLAGFEFGLAFFADAANRQRACPCGQGGQQHEGQRAHAAPGIVKIADQQQKHPFEAAGRQIVDPGAKERKQNQNVQ